MCACSNSASRSRFTSRRARLANSTSRRANPSGGWVTQQARNFALECSNSAPPVRFRVRDRDRKFPRGHR